MNPFSHPPARTTETLHEPPRLGCLVTVSATVPFHNLTILWWHRATPWWATVVFLQLLSEKYAPSQLGSSSSPNFLGWTWIKKSWKKPTIFRSWKGLFGYFELEIPLGFRIEQKNPPTESASPAPNRESLELPWALSTTNPVCRICAMDAGLSRFFGDKRDLPPEQWRESLFHGAPPKKTLRNWVDEFIPYYMEIMGV